MANTTAIDSKQSRRAKLEGSPALLCAFGLHFGEQRMSSSDRQYINRLFYCLTVPQNWQNTRLLASLVSF